MNEAIGIQSFGGYVPWLRLERSVVAQAHGWYAPGLKGLAKGQRAISAWDEDSVTLAVEAARSCLDGGDGAGLGTLVLASTTLPFADRQNAVIVKEALDLADTIASFDVTGSRRAGTSALLAALNAARFGSDALCVAAEKPRTQPASESELTAGDGAAALRVGRGDLAAILIGSHSVSVDFVDQFRATTSEFDYGWESRWVREEGYDKLVVKTVRAALKQHGIDPKAVNHFLLDAPMSGVSARAAKSLGMAETAAYAGLVKDIGYTGPAAPLLQLVHCLEAAQPEQIIVVVGFGQGCDVLIFRTTSAIAKRQPKKGLRAWLAGGRSTENYIRYLTINGLLKVERGMRAEMDMKTALTGLYRDRRTVLGLVGGRNRMTGTVQYPRTEVAVDAKGRKSEWDDYRFAEVPARIASFTADRLAFYIDPPGYYGMVDFEGGGRITMDFADMEPADAAVGRAMRMAFRIKAHDEARGFVRYFWKAVPQR